MCKLLLGLLLSVILIADETTLRLSKERPLENRPKHHVTADVKLVLVPITVTDRRGSTVEGLTVGNFQVLEDGVPQKIASFASQEVPVSVGIVFDLSGSMRQRLPDARTALKAFLNTAGPGDDALLITFAERPKLTTGFTRDLSGLISDLLFERAVGSTALIDAVYLAFDQMPASRNPRKALLIVSDGGDNNSRYSKKELMTAALEADVQIYTIAFQPDSKHLEEKRGIFLLEDLAELTGGLNFVAQGRKDVADAAEKIGRVLRQQYVIGYRPSGPGLPGKWHKIRVTLEPPKGHSRLRVRARSGYYDPQ